MQKAILNTAWHGVPAGTVVVVVGQYTDIQGNDILVVEREDGQLLPGPWGEDARANIAADFLELVATVPATKLTRRQYDALCDLHGSVGQTVDVLTSEYTANVNPDFVRRAKGIHNSSALRGLEAKGFIRIVDSFWKGATVEVLRGLPDDVTVTNNR